MILEYIFRYYLILLCYCLLLLFYYLLVLVFSLIVMIILTFVAYSLLAGVLASMTTNLEDFQQLQTPIVIISLVGYYLSMMASMFSGSLFIKVVSYIPFISSMLSPTLYVATDAVGVVDQPANM